MIVEIPEVLDSAQLEKCRAALQRAKWHDGRETAGHVAVQAKDNQQLSENDPLTSQLGNFILERLGASERFMAAALPLKVLPPRFNRYTGGGSYGNHIDNAVFSVPGTAHRIRSDLSATLFLSDPSEYEGGELVVETGLEARRFKLAGGHMLLYPANTLHRVMPVTKGTRLASFFWVQSLVREHDRRAMLLELDDAIRELNGREDPVRTKLAGIYHNLLRQWSQT